MATRPPRQHETIQVIPLGHTPKYSVSVEQAETMVARGQALWLTGLKVIQECKRQSLSADNRSWRKTISYDPESRVGIAVMQLVPPRERRPKL